jgi:uncharacterized protein
MKGFVPPDSIDPVPSSGRIPALDSLRGAALLGVLLVNLLGGFRISLFESILTVHTRPGWANHAVDILVEWVFEFKAFTLFSLLFGVGVGVQQERKASRKIKSFRFFIRRFVALLGIGLCHMLLIWNGDILALYAICGLLLIPTATISPKRLGIAGMAIIGLAPYLPFFGGFFPTDEAMRTQSVIATRVYSTGSFIEILFLRVSEAGHFILPLLISSLPRTFGLMLVGIAAWRSGILQQPGKHSALFKGILVGAGSLGALTTTLHVWSRNTGRLPPNALDWLYPYSSVLLAFGYGAGLLLWLHSISDGIARRLARLLAAGGRMSLSNYLMQSVIFSVVFYGFGFGLFGKLGSAAAALIGLVVFGAQLIASEWWLRRYCFGPAEWLWRSLSYERWQPLKRKSVQPGRSDVADVEIAK